MLRRSFSGSLVWQTYKLLAMSPQKFWHLLSNSIFIDYIRSLTINRLLEQKCFLYLFLLLVVFSAFGAIRTGKSTPVKVKGRIVCGTATRRWPYLAKRALLPKLEQVVLIHSFSVAVLATARHWSDHALILTQSIGYHATQKIEKTVEDARQRQKSRKTFWTYSRYTLRTRLPR